MRDTFPSQSSPSVVGGRPAPGVKRAGQLSLPLPRCSTIESRSGSSSGSWVCRALHVLQQFINGVDVEVGQFKALDLGRELYSGQVRWGRGGCAGGARYMKGMVMWVLLYGTHGREQGKAGLRAPAPICLSGNSACVQSPVSPFIMLLVYTALEGLACGRTPCQEVHSHPPGHLVPVGLD